MFTVSKILVPVDFSEGSVAALQHAVSLGQQLEAKVDVLHVAEVPSFRTEPQLAEGMGAKTLREYAIAAGKTELGAFLNKFPPGERAQMSGHVEAGRPRDCILERAKRDGYDLIVMGTHGRTGRAHSFAGSVAESVVRTSTCPVLTVRAAGWKSA